MLVVVFTRAHKRDLTDLDRFDLKLAKPHVKQASQTLSLFPRQLLE